MPIHEIDQDQQSTGFFGSGLAINALQQEIADWAYFFDGANLDPVNGYFAP